MVNVIGGTGRFSSASGTFSVSVEQDANNVVTSVWNGSVAY